MIQTPTVEVTQQNHHGYDHEYITDWNVKLILAIFTIYPRHFLRRTLAICANYLRHPHNNTLNHHILYIESPSPFHLFSQRDYRVTRPWILKLCFHTSGEIIADRMSGYG